MKSIWRAWDEFWFAPQSPTPIALYRILFGLIVLQLIFIHLGQDFLAWYGSRGVAPIEEMKTFWWQFHPRLDLLLLLPPNDAWLMTFFAVFAIASFCLTIGLFSRASAIVVFLSLTSLHHHNPLNINAGDVFMRLAAFFLIFSNAGAAFSVDRLLQSRREDWREVGFAPRICSPWAQRMLQVQFCIVYLHTVYSKLMGEVWRNGTAIYYSTRFDDLFRFPMPFVSDNMIMCQILTWATLIIELALGTLVWYRPARYWVLAAGAGLHLGIDLMINIPMFEWLMITAMVVFVEPQDLSSFWDRVKSIVGKVHKDRLRLSYNEQCLFCVRRAGFFHRLDILGLVELTKLARQPTLEIHELPVRTGSSQLTGSSAFRLLSCRLPLLWPLAPLLFIPATSRTLATAYNMATGETDLGMRSRSAAAYEFPALGKTRLVAFKRYVPAFVVIAGLPLLLVANVISSSHSSISNISHKWRLYWQEQNALRELNSLGILLPQSSKPFKLPYSSWGSEDAGREPAFDNIGRPVSLLDGKSASTAGGKIVQLAGVLSHNPDPDQRTVKLLKKLAHAYWLERKMSEADVIYRYLWEVQSKKVAIQKRYDPELLSIILDLAALYRDWGLYPSAASQYRTALSYEEQAPTKRLLDIARDTNNLALVEHLSALASGELADRKLKFQESERLYQKALGIYRQTGSQPWSESIVLKNSALLARDAKGDWK